MADLVEQFLEKVRLSVRVLKALDVDDKALREIPEELVCGPDTKHRSELSLDSVTD